MKANMFLQKDSGDFENKIMIFNIHTERMVNRERERCLIFADEESEEEKKTNGQRRRRI